MEAKSIKNWKWITQGRNLILERNGKYHGSSADLTNNTVAVCKRGKWTYCSAQNFKVRQQFKCSNLKQESESANWKMTWQLEWNWGVEGWGRSKCVDLEIEESRFITENIKVGVNGNEDYKLHQKVNTPNSRLKNQGVQTERSNIRLNGNES